MDKHQQIQEVYRNATSYPHLVQGLTALGILSYTVDTATGTILYRFAGGENLLHASSIDPRSIAPVFNEQKTIQAIRDNQQKKTDYPGFMNDIAAAGVRFYEATLEGSHKRVTYIGTGGSYEEAIPV